MMAKAKLGALVAQGMGEQELVAALVVVVNHRATLALVVAVLAMAVLVAQGIAAPGEEHRGQRAAPTVPTILLGHGAVATLGAAAVREGLRRR